MCILKNATQRILYQTYQELVEDIRKQQNQIKESLLTFAEGKYGFREIFTSKLIKKNEADKVVELLSRVFHLTRRLQIERKIQNMIGNWIYKTFRNWKS